MACISKWSSLTNTYKETQEIQAPFCKPRFHIWIHTGGPVFIQCSTTIPPHLALFSVFAVIIWKFFKSIAILEAWARNLVLSSLKTFQHFYTFHSSLLPTTNYIALNAHTTQKHFLIISQSIYSPDKFPDRQCAITDDIFSFGKLSSLQPLLARCGN